MRKTRHTESEIIRILKEVEAERKVAEACREYHIADATLSWSSLSGTLSKSVNLVNHMLYSL